VTKGVVIAGALAAALGVMTARAEAQARRPITQADSRKTIRLARGAVVQLRLAGPRVWNQPDVSTKAVVLTPVYYFVYPGYQEWTIKARSPGKTVITAVGRREGSATKRFRVTLVIRPTSTATKAGA
jgi:hypothetical protein